MEELINQLFEIVKDHRSDEGFMTKERISRWVNQFARKDRIFILEETIHILNQRYISEASGKKHVKKMIKYVAKLYNCETVKELVESSYFIDNQDEGKSQGHLLEFLDDVLKSEFDTSLDDQNDVTPRHILYFDDFLCTGQTIMEGLFNKETGWLHESTFDEKETNHDYIKNDKGKLCLCYLAVHDRCTNKLGKRASTQGISIGWEYIWAGDFRIENDIDKQESKLNFLFPTEKDMNELSEECKSQIEGKIHEAGYNKTTCLYQPAPSRQLQKTVVARTCLFS